MLLALLYCALYDRFKDPESCPVDKHRFARLERQTYCSSINGNILERRSTCSRYPQRDYRTLVEPTFRQSIIQ